MPRNPLIFQESPFTQLVLDLRDRLKQRYASGGDEAAMEAGKQREIADFRQRYEVWRDQGWPKQHRYDAWVAAPINNARLLPFGLYDQWKPAFATLFRQADAQWSAFYLEVRRLGQLPKSQRDQALKRLADETVVAHRPLIVRHRERCVAI